MPGADQCTVGTGWRRAVATAATAASTDLDTSSSMGRSGTGLRAAAWMEEAHACLGSRQRCGWRCRRGTRSWAPSSLASGTNDARDRRRDEVDEAAARRSLKTRSTGRHRPSMIGHAVPYRRSFFREVDLDCQLSAPRIAGDWPILAKKIRPPRRGSNSTQTRAPQLATGTRQLYIRFDDEASQASSPAKATRPAAPTWTSSSGPPRIGSSCTFARIAAAPCIHTRAR
ncbi:uncharacterized protein K452DRAFT_306316 [Aplosporella prunicola CBS 121167]|uniref:Uncharacterized protein n=1 Tax=Aplosporella prunicola CBS 121167 TaxID=1176127 RepID=A0A6A6BLD8_9PEZI|nr:uncharacterized protein K452DRAFT_306316 [Aplosporella prunicola CBS 121167]KAF2144488.1 hypothetical protein K452DRAFT_306316 [Aplosporella prunicola CBS 121167]